MTATWLRKQEKLIQNSTQMPNNPNNCRSRPTEEKVHDSGNKQYSYDIQQLNEKQLWEVLYKWLKECYSDISTCSVNLSVCICEVSNEWELGFIKWFFILNTAEGHNASLSSSVVQFLT